MDSKIIPEGYEGADNPMAVYVYDICMYVNFLLFSMVIFLLAIKKDNVVAGAGFINLIVWLIELFDFFMSRNFNFQFNIKDYIIFFLLLYLLTTNTHYRIKTKGRVTEIINITNFSILKFFTSKSLAEQALRASRRNVLAEQILLRSQLNSDFIFTSLKSIQQFVYKNKKELAASTLAKFAKLMRCILENSRQECVDIEQELETLRLYLELHKIQFDSRFSYQLLIDPKIHAQIIFITPMVTIPFIDQLLKTCFISDYGNNIIISFNLDENNILCKASNVILPPEKKVGIISYNLSYDSEILNYRILGKEKRHIISVEKLEIPYQLV